MPFSNRIRLPFYLSKPQFPSERNIFPLADGSRRVQSIVVRKTYQLETNYLPEVIHQRLLIALSHDDVTIEGDRYLGGVSIDSEYEINWEAFLDLPVAKATAKIQVVPFDATNSNCQTCDNAAQVGLVDDTFPDPLDEGDLVTINVFANDSISCYPGTASITTFNPTYVQSATIDPDGTVDIQLKTPLPLMDGVNLLTYRVTCPDGSYDEADVFADINGSVIVCGQPTDITGNATQDSIPLSWTAPGTPPADGYEWQLFDCANPGTPVQSGSTATPNVTITGLNPATCYWFYVRSKCGPTDFSAYLGAQFSTAAPPGANTCGLYQVTWNDGSGDATHVTAFTYMSCGGTYFTIPLYNMVDRILCMAQHADGDPIDAIGATAVNFVSSPC